MASLGEMGEDPESDLDNLSLIGTTLLAPIAAIQGADLIEAKGCSVCCIPTGARTTGTRRKLVARGQNSRLTQVHWALQRLGITLIPAYSPEALRARFRTLQDRLAQKNWRWLAWRRPISSISPSGPAHLQPALCGVGHGIGHSVCAENWDRSGRYSVC